jgi:modulator of FtsH protease
MLENKTSVLGRSESAVQTTNKVLRNTYALLGLTMIPTVIGAAVGLSMNFSFLAASPIISMIVMMVAMYGMTFLIAKNANSSMGIWLLFAFTFMMGVLLGPILQHALHFSNGTQMVGLAAGGTAAAFLTLAGIARNTKRDFSNIGKFLTVGFVVVLLAIVANMFFQIPALSLTISAVIVLLMAGFILFEINQVVRGGQTNYVLATMSIYISLHNMFTSLLHLIMSFMGSDD